LPDLPYPLALLILLRVDVAILTYGIMPKFTALMDFWLHPSAHSNWRTELAGFSVIFALIGATLGLTLWFQ